MNKSYPSSNGLYSTIIDKKLNKETKPYEYGHETNIVIRVMGMIF